MLRLIEDLLDATRIQAGSFRIHRERLNPRRVIDDASAALVPLMEDKALKLVSGSMRTSPPSGPTGRGCSRSSTTSWATPSATRPRAAGSASGWSGAGTASSSASRMKGPASPEGGTQSWLLYYVMPYVEGETLRARLRHERQLPVAEAVRLATQVASALDYAHRHGVVHRDIKPENILIHDGSALVADFGIALAVSHAAERMTSTGLAIGTPQYMSPEQAVGDRLIDGRTDVYSLGAVLYEMLAGEPPHTGATAQAVLTRRIIEVPRPVRELRRSVPPHIELALQRALERLPADRWATAAEFAAALAVGPLVGTLTPPGVPALRPLRAWRSGAPWAVAALEVAVAAVSLLGLLPSPAGPPPASPGHARAVSFELIPPERVQVGRLGPVSPDGRYVVYEGVSEAGESALWLHSLEQGVATRLAGTETGSNPFWSPDSRHIAFFTGANELKRVDAGGGPPELIAPRAWGMGGGAWNRDGVIIFSPALVGPLLRVDAAGGEPRALTSLDPELKQLVHQWPMFLPGGRRFLYATREVDGQFVIYGGSLDDPGERRRIARVGSAFAYAPPGYLLFLRGTTLMAQRFDPGTLQLSGEARPITDPLVLADPHRPGTFWASDDGVLVYQSRPVENSQLVWIDRAGTITGTLGPPGNYRDFALAPDGRRVVVERFGTDPGLSDLWILDADRDVPTRLTFDAWQESCLLWAPRAHITFCSSRQGRWDIVSKVPVPNGEEMILFEGRAPHAGPSPQDIAPDGSSLIFVNEPAPGLHLVPTDGGGAARPLPYTELARGATFSPDGRWLSFHSTESGRGEVHIMSIDGRDRWQVSRNGAAGWRAAWRRDGRELVFLSPDGAVMAVEIDPGPPMRIGRERALFSPQTLEGCPSCTVGQVFRMTPDGDRFLILRGMERGAGSTRVVLNWRAALRQ
jgi:eukaryotic-like serine/threonine-protein kinase